MQGSGQSENAGPLFKNDDEFQGGDSRALSQVRALPAPDAEPLPGRHIPRARARPGPGDSEQATLQGPEEGSSGLAGRRPTAGCCGSRRWIAEQTVTGTGVRETSEGPKCLGEILGRLSVRPPKHGWNVTARVWHWSPLHGPPRNHAPHRPLYPQHPEGSCSGSVLDRAPGAGEGLGGP